MYHKLKLVDVIYLSLSISKWQLPWSGALQTRSPMQRLSYHQRTHSYLQEGTLWYASQSPPTLVLISPAAHPPYVHTHIHWLFDTRAPWDKLHNN